MTVTDVLSALAPFDEGLAALFGVAIAVYLTTSVIRWFSYAVRASD